MVALGDLCKNIDDMFEYSGNNFNINYYYIFIFSILHIYKKENPKYFAPNSKSYKFLKAYFDDDGAKLMDAINENNEIYFPMVMENMDEKMCSRIIETTVMYFTEDENFSSEIIKEYKKYDFLHNYKEDLQNYINWEFEKIIGLNNIRNDINDLVVLIVNNKIRQKKKLNTTSISMHMVFSGNPGTGKTTIARLIGSIYYRLGLIKTNNFIEVSRQDLVAEYVGQTAVKTAKVLERAKNGILFIDEAYTLVSNSESDYGKESIETILKFMEDNRDNTIIIVAGYENEMKKFIDSNPGLKSRFNKFFHFNDYSSDELYQIFKVFCEKDKYIIDEKEEKKIIKLFRSIDTSMTNFSNARYVRNIYEKAILNQVKRVDKENITDDVMFMTIKCEDIEL